MWGSDFLLSSSLLGSDSELVSMSMTEVPSESVNYYQKHKLMKKNRSEMHFHNTVRSLQNKIGRLARTVNANFYSEYLNFSKTEIEKLVHM